jgi:hypothetical protein
MAWAPVHHAPRDKAVWLFLPSAKFTAAANGTVTDVAHDVVVAKWSPARSAWLTRDGEREVYPSMWNDAVVDGAAPDMPELLQ